MHYQSLYRRYRPQRFADVLGQEHVSETLRKAVATETVAHAYLFSGPRGCGKTTSARILAKALNCTNLHDGEPCDVCDSCKQVTSGVSMDVHEMDAASNNGVEAMRDLVARASLGTAGRRKVYIVDEVHMLSTAASNALLKTLEEPPDHVVFVLATTDPQKVLATVRSRTQHFEFRLFPFATLLELVRGVAKDAGIDLDEATLEAVTKKGAGSARDALSALDQVAAAGGIEDGFDVSELAAAVGARDSGAALTAVDRAMERGRDPRQLARDLIDVVRNVFLSHMGRPSSADVDLVRTLSPAAASRALETIGEALVDMRDALDPRIVLEVALMRLSRADLDQSVAALVERIERLERGVVPAPQTSPAPTSPTPLEADRPAPQVASTAESTVPALPVATTTVAATSAAPSASSASASAPPATNRLPQLRIPDNGASTAGPAVRRAGAADEARARLGSGAGKSAAPPRLGAPTSVPAPTSSTQRPGPTARRTESAPTEAATPTPLDQILDRVSRRARMFLAAGHFDRLDGEELTFVLPNSMHLDRAREFNEELTTATSAQLGHSVTVTLADGGEWVADESTSVEDVRRTVAASPTVEGPESDEDIDLNDLVDAPVDSGPSVLDQIASTFPGAQIVES